jgi:hypothetical protein
MIHSERKTDQPAALIIDKECRKEPRIARISRMKKEENLIRIPSCIPNFYGIDDVVLSVPIRAIRGSSLSWFRLRWVR